MHHSEGCANAINLETPRRLFLRQLAACGLFLFPTVRAFANAFEPERKLSFHNLHTEEKLSVPSCPGKPYPPGVLEQVNHFLRDHRTEQTYPIDPALLDILHAVSALTKSRGTFQVISGYRSPETNSMLQQTRGGIATQSLHVEGKAIDLRLTDLHTEDLRCVGMLLQRGGVGYYPASDFVHLDTGRVRIW
jgi:uncharacterized protein YcbK (DUF882 family)